MKQESQSKLLCKIRITIMFSVLSTITDQLNAVYTSVEIIIFTLAVHFISTIIHSIILGNGSSRRWLHCGYILRSVSRQSILVVSDVVAHSMYSQDFGTQEDNLLIFVIATTAFIAMLSLIPAWFLHDEIQGSLKDMLVYSFSSRYSKLHIPGLQGITGLGTLLYGLLFVIFTIQLQDETQSSLFVTTLHHTTAMVFSNLFLTNITPAPSQQVFPVAILLSMYIISDCIPMSRSVATFLLWRMSREVSSRVSILFSDNFTDQLLFYSVILCVVPIINQKIATVMSVAAIQTLVSYIMLNGVYLGSFGMAVSSMCMLLVTDIVLDSKKSDMVLP
jgi:hypothetical protein